jgi:predicted secreted protein
MNATAAVVLFAVIWFMVFFILLPLRLKTQGEAGEVVPGTPQSAPSAGGVGRKARLTTVVAVLLWAIIAGVIESGWVTLADIDWFGQLDR